MWEAVFNLFEEGESTLTFFEEGDLYLYLSIVYATMDPYTFHSLCYNLIGLGFAVHAGDNLGLSGLSQMDLLFL